MGEFFLNKCFLWKWRHVNHRVTPGFASREQPSSKSRHIIRASLEATASNPDRSYPDIWSTSTRFPLLVNRCWFCLFQRIWSDPKTGPVSVPFSLGNVNLYFSSHRERKKKTSPSYRMRFSATGCPWSECKFQVIWVEILRYFQPSWSLLSKSFGFLDPLRIRLIDYRYMCTVREHTTAFQSQVQRRAVCFFFFINHRQAASAPVKHSGRCQLLFRVVPLSYCALFCSIFSLRIVYWDRVEEVGWGKQLSRNPWTNVVKLCIGTFSTSLLSLST